MKKRGLLFAAVLLIGSLLGGCDTIEDAVDVTFNIDRDYTFTVETNSNTYSYDLDLNTDSDYARYKSKIRKIEISYVRYTILENTGTTGGTVDFYANVNGGSFATATKVAEPINVAVTETRGITDVTWINKAYFENLLMTGQLSGWAVVVGADIRLKMKVEIRVRVTANPFE